MAAAGRMRSPAGEAAAVEEDEDWCWCWWVRGGCGRGSVDVELLAGGEGRRRGLIWGWL
jgi:hypothetical protein